jgi:hypothetical protein
MTPQQAAPQKKRRATAAPVAPTAPAPTSRTVSARPAPQDQSSGKRTGRPSKYDPGICDRIIAFFSRPLQTTKTVTRDAVRIVKGKPVAYKKQETVSITNDIPFIDEFARAEGLAHRTLDRWADPQDKDNYKGDAFCLAFTRAKELQKEFLVKQTLAGRFDSSFAKFTAMNITTWRETQYQELTGRDGAPLVPANDLAAVSDEELDQRIAATMKRLAAVQK